MQNIPRSYPLENLLIQRFHIRGGFHPGQKHIIEQFIQGKRILAIQRTGWGKSLCYQMASLYYPGLTIVFSPLKALMRDQLQRCNEVYAIPSAIVSSDFTDDENEHTLKQAITGTLKLLFISPERLNNALWQSYASKMRMSMIVIDEAHCISTWGHDFRPDYRRMVRLLEALPRNTPVLALTATANKRVEEDIRLQVGNVQVMRGTMQRPNLSLTVVHVQQDKEKLAYLAQLLSILPGTGILYTATKASAEMVAAFFVSQQITATHYHAGLEDAVRRDVEQKWMRNEYKVICSTNALGMGIDKADTRFVIHYHIPASPIHYYQEIGRAGRDGEKAHCILLYDSSDVSIQEYFIQSSKPGRNYYDAVLRTIRLRPMGEQEILLETGFARNVTRTILADLEEQRFIERNVRDRKYAMLKRTGDVDLAVNEAIRQQKEQELRDIQQYASTHGCYMGYLTAYLGDEVEYRCNSCKQCRPQEFPLLVPSARIQQAVVKFLEEEALPRIEKRFSRKELIHEAGWSLSYYGNTRIGELVRLSKYKGAGPFPDELVVRAVQVVRKHYPLETIQAVVSVPPTRSGTLVEGFARRVAAMLHREYVPAVIKVRETDEQKNLTNRLQKAKNVKDAFAVPHVQQIRGRVLLLIDDIYDSGYILREVAQALIEAGAQDIYPLTITKTQHSDDQ